MSGTHAAVAGSITIMDQTRNVSCDAVSSVGHDAFFELTAPRSGMLTLKPTREVGQDVVVTVFSGASCAASTELPGGCRSTYDVNPTVTVPVTQGTKYWIRAVSYTHLAAACASRGQTSSSTRRARS